MWLQTIFNPRCMIERATVVGLCVSVCPVELSFNIRSVIVPTAYIKCTGPKLKCHIPFTAILGLVCVGRKVQRIHLT